MSYDPNSNDSMFSRIEQRLSNQDNALEEILREVRKTNGRVTALEQANEVNRAKVSTVAAGVSIGIACIGWIAEHLLLKDK